MKYRKLICEGGHLKSSGVKLTDSTTESQSIEIHSLPFVYLLLLFFLKHKADL